MIAFGICIGSEDKFLQYAKPSISRHGEEDSLVFESRDNSSIFTAYNEVLDALEGVEDLEALVLMHEDVQITDADFAAKVRRAVTTDGVAVAGVIGARGVRSLAWWEAEGIGRCTETRGLIQFGSQPEELELVDVVDGLMLILSPWAVANLRFDAERYQGFHGYDADLCLSARAAGERVVVADIDVIHHTKGGLGDAVAYHLADVTFRDKWFPVDRETFPDGRSATCPCCDTTIRGLKATGSEIAPCPTCGTAATIPSPGRDIAGAGIWEDQYSGTRLAMRPQWFYEAQQRVAWLQLYQPSGSLIEAGAGTGEFSRTAMDAGYDTVAVEPSSWAADHCNRLGVPTFAGTTTDLLSGSPDLRVDAVAAWHVIEHLHDPAEFLREVHALLKPGGHLAIEVPNFGASTARADPLGWARTVLNDHVFHFTERGLRDLLARTGFEVITTIPMSTRVYEAPAVWSQNAVRLRAAGFPEPPLELLRAMARKV